MRQVADLKAYTAKDQVFRFEGAVSMHEGPHWVSPVRVEASLAHHYPMLWAGALDPQIIGPAQRASGIRLTFTTTATDVVLALDTPEEGMKFDLVVDGKLVEEAHLVRGTDQLAFKPLAEGQKNVAIWLDPHFAVRLKSVSINAEALIKSTEVAQKRWVHYGSSISHAKAAHTPSKIWAGLAAQQAGLHLTNLGYGGQCHLDPMVARLISQLPMDLLTIKVGINIYSNNSLNLRTFRSNLHGFIFRIREQHPEVPFGVLSAIYCPPRETKKNEVDLNLQDYREMVEEVVGIFNEHGDRHLHYLDGREICGEGDAAHLPDGVHPDGDAQFFMADRFVEKIIHPLLGT